jgi:hypothetical protein
MSPDAPRFRWVPPGELHLHPALERYGIAATTAERNKFVQGNRTAFREPVDVTTDGTILDGYLQWTAAVNEGRKLILCVEHSLAEYERVEWLLWRHRRRNGFNKYCRILIALEFESKLRKAALDNQSAGGRTKGLSILTKAAEMHVRSKLAELADVCEAYIDYVKQLRAGADSKILQALEGGEISIHWAWKLLRFSQDEQRSILEEHRIDKAVRLAHRRRPKRNPVPMTQAIATETMRSLAAIDITGLTISVLEISGKRLVISKELFTSMQSPRQLELR